MRERTILIITLLGLGIIAAGVATGVVVQPLTDIATAEAQSVNDK